MKRLLFLVWHSFKGGIAALIVVSASLFLGGKLGVVPAFSAYVILSGSMEPALPVGSVAIAQQQTAYSVGDVITFKRPGEKIATSHRIADISKNGEFVTKGDANKSTDTGTVAPASITGKVFLTVPYIGYVVDFAKSPKGFLSLIVIPATIIVYEELKNIWKELLAGLRKKRKTIAQQRTFKNITPIAVFLVVLVSGSLFTATAGAYFYDKEGTQNNILGASASFGEKTANLYNSDPFTCADGASNTADPNVGFVVIKLVGGTVKLDAKLVGATPNSSYDIWVNQDPGGCPLSSPTAPAALLTDGSGNGVAHVETAFVPGATNFWISAVGGGQVLRSIAVTLP